MSSNGSNCFNVKFNKLDTCMAKGAVHKVCHPIFGQFWPPPPLSQFVTHPGTPKSMSHILAPPIFVQGVLSGGLLSGRFFPGWFLSVPPSDSIQQKVKHHLNFMFPMYDKKIYKHDVTCSWAPPPVTNCHTFSDPSPSSMTYFMDGPKDRAWKVILKYM